MPFILSSMMINITVPGDKTHLHSMMLPPPCVFSVIWSVVYSLFLLFSYRSFLQYLCYSQEAAQLLEAPRKNTELAALSGRPYELSLGPYLFLF